MPKVCPSWLLRSKKRLRTAQIPRKKSGGAGGAESKCRILDVLPGDEQLFFSLLPHSGLASEIRGPQSGHRGQKLPKDSQYGWRTTNHDTDVHVSLVFIPIIYILYIYIWLVVWNIFPQQQNALGSSAIVKVSEQTGAAPKPIPPRFPGSK